MKKNIIRRFRELATLTLFLSISLSNSAVNLIVSGITNPTTANGTYVPNGTLYGYSSWKFVNGANTYYLYNDLYNSATQRYWNIDNDTDDSTDPYFFSTNATSDTSPITVTSWSALNGGTGSPIIQEEGAPLVPEINLKGNNTDISSGDTDPSYSDFTKFGAADITTGTVTRSFTIQNNGAGTLTISNISISGANATDFTVSASPSLSMAGTSSTNFQITFNPSAIGNRNATITINNNDSNEGAYTFSIQGYGYSSVDITVSGITTPAAANGKYIFQGVSNNFMYWKHETLNYYIYNKDYSGRYWNIDVNQIDTDNNYLFFIASEEGKPVGLTSWTANNNTGYISAGSPFITEGTPTPEINIIGNNASIVKDDVTPSFTDQTNFGTLDISSGSRSRIFTIQNLGNGALNIGGSSPYVTISGTNASDFSVTTIPSTTIAASGSTDFTVLFDPTTIGTKTATITISNNDPDEGVYSFDIQGDGISPKNIIVSGITNPIAANGTYIYQGILNEFQYWKHSSGSYYVYNKLYSNARSWNIDTDTDDTHVTFFASDHVDVANPNTITAWGVENGSTSTGVPIIQYLEPKINITGNLNQISDGSNTPLVSNYTDFGNVNVNTGTIARNYTIQNTGNLALNLTGTPKVVITGANAADFTITNLPNSPIAATNGTTTFTISFNPSDIGVRTATVSIANDDTNENPYDFSIQGNGILPEMNVVGNGINISDGNITPSTADFTDFGSINTTSGTVTKTFIIQNIGTDALNLTGTPKISISGTNAADFTVSSQPTSPIAVTTGTTSFEITFDPSAIGTRTASISIANDDNDENPYNFSIQGVGIIEPTVTTQAVTNITNVTAVGNGSISSLGYTNPTQYGVVWSTSPNPTISLPTKTEQGSISTTSTFTSEITGLTPNTTYYVKAYAANLAGVSYGNEVNFTTSNTTKIENLSQDNINILPNATKSGFIINTGAKLSTLSIYELSGVLVISKSVSGDSYIDVSKLKKGIYIVKVNDYVGKLIKE